MPDTHERLLQHLPTIYHKWETLRQLLALFENFLFGRQRPETEEQCSRHTKSEQLSVADNIAAVAGLFNARQTPLEFLPWLSQWVALSGFDDLSEAHHRRLIAQIVPLYALRGTKVYLEKLIDLFKPDALQVEVDDSGLQGFKVGDSKVGVNTVFLSERPFWFRVTVTPPSSGESGTDFNAIRKQWERRLRRVIDLAKPVHTMYELDWRISA